MSESFINTSIDGAVAVITMNRPQAMNALSVVMREQLVNALMSVNANREVRVVILTGEGKAFCAGLDFSELKSSANGVSIDTVIGQELLDALAELDTPVIAAVNGYAITGGLELALCCDVILASTKAVFADTHAKVGIVPAWGVTQRLPRIIGPLRAKEMSLSGRKIDAQLACQWGLANRVVEPEQLLAEAHALALEMVDCDAGAQRAIKTLIDVGWMAAIEDGLQMEKAASVQVFRNFVAKN